MQVRVCKRECARGTLLHVGLRVWGGAKRTFEARHHEGLPLVQWKLPATI